MQPASARPEAIITMVSRDDTACKFLEHLLDDANALFAATCR